MTSLRETRDLIYNTSVDNYIIQRSSVNHIRNISCKMFGNVLNFYKKTGVAWTVPFFIAMPSETDVIQFSRADYSTEEANLGQCKIRKRKFY